MHTIDVHPGAVLRDELDERSLNQRQLAIHVGVLPKTINEICREKRGISAEMAFKLASALGGLARLLAEPPEKLGTGPGGQKSGCQRLPGLRRERGVILPPLAARNPRLNPHDHRQNSGWAKLRDERGRALCPRSSAPFACPPSSCRTCHPPPQHNIGPVYPTSYRRAMNLAQSIAPKPGMRGVCHCLGKANAPTSFRAFRVHHQVFGMQMKQLALEFLQRA